MNDLFNKIYLNKNIKYCAGCLHTEDVTKLSKMQNYAWIFTALFPNLYLTEDLHDSWICSWCIRRINNAKKLLMNFQSAQYILWKINSVLTTSNSHEINVDLCSEINELKKKSKLYSKTFSDTCIIDSSSINYTQFINKYELEVKSEESCNLDDCQDKSGKEYQIDSDIDFEEHDSSEYRYLRSQKSKNILKTERSLTKMSKKLKSNNKVKKSLIKKDNCSQKTKKNILKSEMDDLNGASSNDNSEYIDNNENNVSKEELKVVKVEHDNKDKIITDIDQLCLSTLGRKSHIHDIPVLCTKSGSMLEYNDSTLEEKSNLKVKKCEKQRKRPRNYLPHVKRIPCNECDREFTKEMALHNHIIRKHKKKYPCEKCDRVFIKAEFVKTHMAKVHEPKRGLFECAFCGTIYKNRHKMVQHMNKHEKYGPSLKDLENIVCDHCGKLCDRSNIKKHLIKHSQVKNYHCEFCDASFKTPEVREEHTRRKHMDPDVGRRFPCPQCPKRFFTSTQVKYHMTAMHSVLGKPCPVCSKCFATKSKVREHILRVHDKVPAIRDKQCDFCDKAFSTRRQLKHHRYTHTGEKPYKCDLCTSAYNQKHCLSVHKLRAHNVETPKTLIKNISNATVTNLHVAGEFSSNVVNWYGLNMNESRQDSYGRETSH